MERSFNISGEGPSRKIQLIEVVVFLLLILPSMLLSSAVAEPENLTFLIVAGSTMLSDIPLLCLVVYFVWRNEEPFQAIGLTLRSWWKEAILGAVLFIPLALGMGLVGRLIREAGFPVPQKTPSFLVPSGGGQITIALLFLVVVAVSEEVIFRGYLIRRFTAVTGNPVIALLLSSAVFAMGHGYERSGGVMGVGILGLVFGTVYLWRRSLIAPMVMHFIQDFIGIILIPFHLLS
jgi:membrane protease YdiL (CAAX protease family)